MQILIVGAGAIGIAVGYRLEQAGHHVILCGRPALAEAAAMQGVLVHDHTGEHRLQADIITDLARAPAPDLILLTVKAFDTGSAAKQLRSLGTAEGIPIVLIQNGVGGEEAGLAELPRTPWIGAITTLVADRLGPAAVRVSRPKASMGLAPLAHGDEHLDAVVRAFDGAGFDEVRRYESYAAMKWSKLLLNMLGNAIPAILDMSPGEVMADRQAFRAERAAYREALAVMRASHIRPVPLPGYPVPTLAMAIDRLPSGLVRPAMARFIERGRGGKRPSLYMDLSRHKGQSEVSFLNGAVVRQGARVGVAAPVNRAITETLLAIAGGREDWDTYRGNPAALLARCGLSR